MQTRNDYTVLVVNPSSRRWSATPVGTCLTVACRSSRSLTSVPHVSKSCSGIYLILLQIHLRVFRASLHVHYNVQVGQLRCHIFFEPFYSPYFTMVKDSAGAILLETHIRIPCLLNAVQVVVTNPYYITFFNRYPLLGDTVSPFHAPLI